MVDRTAGLLQETARDRASPLLRRLASVAPERRQTDPGSGHRVMDGSGGHAKGIFCLVDGCAE